MFGKEKKEPERKRLSVEECEHLIGHCFMPGFFHHGGERKDWCQHCGLVKRYETSVVYEQPS